jgi:hypothetical protein
MEADDEAGAELDSGPALEVDDDTTGKSADVIAEVEEAGAED